MDNAFYVTLSKQTALFRQMGVIANNVANANTAGYKAEKMLFTQMVEKGVGNEKVSFAHDVATVRNMNSGALARTGSPLDVSINGEGFFLVDTEQGERYTKAGNFGVNAEGELVTASGDRVTGNSGEALVLPEGSTDIFIREDGMIQVYVNDNAEEVGQIGVVMFDDPGQLVPEGNSLFKGEGAYPAEAGASPIIQGSLEQSNVNSVQEMTKMIEVSRAVGGTAKLTKDLHEMIIKAIGIISRQG